MISATEAAALFNLPPYTLEHVEQQIRIRALTGDYICLEKSRVTTEVFGQLQEAGYTVDVGIENFIVRWRE